MEISEAMINFYLMNVTTGGKNPDDFSPEDVEDLSEYYSFIQNMKNHAARHGDLDTLKLGFEYILANPDYKCVWMAGPVYSYEEQQVREIIEYAWKIIWPDSKPIASGGPKDVKLVPTTLEQWWESRGYDPNQKTLEASKVLQNKLNTHLLG